MSDLNTFAQEIKTRLQRTSNKKPDWDDQTARTYMAEFCGRKVQFEKEAEHLINTIILPRLEKVIEQLPHGSKETSMDGTSCRALFGYSERFPATTKIEFCIEHDVTWAWLYVRYQLYMMPLFIKGNFNDRLTLPLEGVMRRDTSSLAETSFNSVEPVDHAVENWVEKRLLEFLDTYAELDRGEESPPEGDATDPVCGMRLNGKQAIQHSYKGHPYFFCSSECIAAFDSDPMKFINFKIM